MNVKPWTEDLVFPSVDARRWFASQPDPTGHWEPVSVNTNRLTINPFAEKTTMFDVTTIMTHMKALTPEQRAELARAMANSDVETVREFAKLMTEAVTAVDEPPVKPALERATDAARSTGSMVFDATLKMRAGRYVMRLMRESVTALIGASYPDVQAIDTFVPILFYYGLELAPGKMPQEEFLREACAAAFKGVQHENISKLLGALWPLFMTLIEIGRAMAANDFTKLAEIAMREDAAEAADALRKEKKPALVVPTGETR